MSKKKRKKKKKKNKRRFNAKREYANLQAQQQMEQQPFPRWDGTVPAVEKAAPYHFIPNMQTRFLQNTDNYYEAYASQGFRGNSLVYAAIMFKARAVTQAPLYAHVNDDANPERLPSDHPMQMLMMQPNPYMPGSDLQIIRTILYNLAGNSYIYVERDATGMPLNLYPLRPDRVYEVVHNNRLDYIYVPQGRTHADAFPILHEDMIHDKMFDPLDEYEGMGKGMSPLQSAAKAIDFDNKMSGFFNKMVDRGVMPSGLLASEQIITTKDAEEARHSFQARYGSSANWGDVLVLGNGMNYQQLGLSLDKMVVDKLDARSEARILQALGVSPLLVATPLGLQSSTYTNQEQERQKFWEDVFAFELMEFASTYNSKLSVNGQYRFMHDLSSVQALSGDMEKQSQNLERLVSVGIPLNTALKLVGIDTPDIEGGDTAFINSFLVPVDSLINPPPPAEPAPEMTDEMSRKLAHRSPENTRPALEIPRQLVKELVTYFARVVTGLEMDPEIVAQYFDDHALHSIYGVFRRYDVPQDNLYFYDLTQQLKLIFTDVIATGRANNWAPRNMADSVTAVSEYMVGRRQLLDNIYTPETRDRIDRLGASVQYDIVTKSAHNILFVDGDVAITDHSVERAISAVSGAPLLADILNADIMEETQS